jgi:hypothetical protein
MNIRPDDIMHAVGSGDKWSMTDLAREMYGSVNAADPLMAYNSFSFPKDQPIPGGTMVALPHTLTGMLYDLKKGFAKADLFVIQPRILDLQWKTREIVAYDGSDKPEMYSEVIGKTISCPDETAATFEIYQYDSKGKHDLVDSNPACKIVKNELKSANGKPLKIWLEWHKSMYEWERPWYFGKLIIGQKEFVMPQKNEAMLRLKQYHYLVNDPASDFPATVQDECSMVRAQLETKGSFWNAFFKTENPATHFSNTEDGGKNVVVKKGSYCDLMNRGIVYHHHIRTHGIAICQCDGNDNWVTDKEGISGKDGVVDWLCPVCKKSASASGAFCFENNLVVTATDVQALLHVPKLLLISSSCLTGITDKFPKSWIDLGTRWYIGWAVPVFFSSAYNFSNKFYSLWCNKFKMHPDKVKDVFDAISGSFWNCRPRLFGK